MTLRTVLFTFTLLTTQIATSFSAAGTDNPPTLTLGSLGETEYIRSGTKLSVPITYSGPNLRYSSLDLRFVYNERAMLLLKVNWGPMFRRIPTEPVYYQQTSLDTTLKDNLNATIHLMALSKIGDTDITVDEMIEINDGDTLVMLDFHLSGDRSLACSLLPLRWFWMECGDNSLVTNLGTLSSFSVSDLLVNDWIRRTYRVELIDPPVEPPSLGGVPTGCMLTQLGVANAGRRMLFVNGGVWIPCGDILTRGDLNFNGIGGDTGDVSLLARNITRGDSVFVLYPSAQLQESYVNEDKIRGDISDFVFLLRRAFGKQKLEPLLEEFFNVDTVTLQHTGGALSANRELAALLLVFNGPAKVTVHDKNMQMTEGQIDGDTYVLIYGRIAGEGHILRHSRIVDDSEMPLIPAGTILKLDGVLKRAEAANYDGYKLHTVITH